MFIEVVVRKNEQDVPYMLNVDSITQVYPHHLGGTMVHLDRAVLLITQEYGLIRSILRSQNRFTKVDS